MWFESQLITQNLFKKLKLVLVFVFYSGQIGRGGQPCDSCGRGAPQKHWGWWRTSKPTPKRKALLENLLGQRFTSAGAQQQAAMSAFTRAQEEVNRYCCTLSPPGREILALSRYKHLCREFFLLEPILSPLRGAHLYQGMKISSCSCTRTCILHHTFSLNTSASKMLYITRSFLLVHVAMAHWKLYYYFLFGIFCAQDFDIKSHSGHIYHSLFFGH